MAVEKLSFVSVVGKKFVKDDLYSGGPVLMDNCRFENCEWKMQGTAAIVVQALENCGWKIVPPQPDKIH